MSVRDNILRIGTFSSSENGRVMGDGRAKNSLPATLYTYAEEIAYEHQLGRPLTDDIDARALSWGKLLEQYVFNEILGTEYILNGDQTLQHPDYDFWTGTPDATKSTPTVVMADVKCPKTMKSFMQMVSPSFDKEYTNILHEALTIGAVTDNNKEGDKYYWQIVSNACITGATKGELIVFMPYKSELDKIRQLANEQPANELYKYYWIANATDDQLPHLIDGCRFNNCNIISFNIPESDKQQLTERLIIANNIKNKILNL